MTDMSALQSSQAKCSARPGIAPFLRINSIIQSYFQCQIRRRYRRQQAATLAAYATLLAVSGALANMLPAGSAMRGFSLGLTFPGAGFLHWASVGQYSVAVMLAALCLALFAAALLLWFATGNIIAPVAVWAGAALFAAFPAGLGLADNPSDASWPWLIGPAVLLLGAIAWLRPSGQTAHAARYKCHPTLAERADAPQDMPAEDMKRLRLLLDRALQPAARFDGFEWRDQFQTAAVRYQVNFMGYALAMAQRRYAPAASATFAEAQANLATKIGDRRMWGYWGLENAWGNLRRDGDPVRHENIMYSGFTALQIALGGGDALVLHRNGTPQRRYDLDDMMAILARQYQASPYGLLACEPNWIYPLYNLITMAGIKAGGARLGMDRWAQLATPFLDSLEREATRADGSFIAFRSSLTGIAPPAPGGIVMQAFPCLFLNALSPELAQAHWHRVRQKLDHGSWKRLFWPVDVGNYGFSRASSYAATAAAEMGDGEIAQECLRRLEAECPSHEIGGVIHRGKASLWAHALEILARCNRADGLRDLVAGPGPVAGPRLAVAPYPDMLVAGARAEAGALELTLYPGEANPAPLLGFDRLMPGRHYATGLASQPFLKADALGKAALRIGLTGRTRMSIKPVV